MSNLNDNFQKYIEVKNKMWSTYEAVCDLNGHMAESKSTQGRKRAHFTTNENVQVKKFLKKIDL